MPELVRGKTGRVFGALTGLLALMKGQPLAYNKDNQEDKEPLFDAADTLRDSLRAFADMVPAIKPKREIMREAALRGSPPPRTWPTTWCARGCRSATVTRSSATR